MFMEWPRDSRGRKDLLPVSGRVGSPGGGKWRQSLGRGSVPALQMGVEKIKAAFAVCLGKSQNRHGQGLVRTCLPSPTIIKYSTAS